MAEETNIVPFGKHKGKPIEALIADQDYVSWLQQQSWFRERYGNIYNIVIMGRSKEEEETPEHNKIQTMFLDEKFREKFMRWFGWSGKLKSSSLKFESEHPQASRGMPPIDVSFYGDQIEPYKSAIFCIEIKPTIGDDYPSVFRQMRKSYASALLVGEYTGVGASKEQFIAFFKTGQIEVAFLSDVLKQQVE